MLKICCDADLGQEAFYAEYGAELGVEELEGDGAIVPDVAGEVDRRHSSGADLPLYVIAFRKGLLELGDRVQGNLSACRSLVPSPARRAASPRPERSGPCSTADTPASPWRISRAFQTSSRFSGPAL